MNGAPSHVDTFDPKPALGEIRWHALQRAAEGRLQRPGGRLSHALAVRVPPPRTRAACRSAASFRTRRSHADDLCVLRAMYTDTAAHASGCLQMNTGSVLIGKPSLGAWLSYGLGSINENLPNFVVMTDPRGGPIGSASNWSSGFMPATYQGTLFRSSGSPLLDLATPPGISDRSQRESIDLINRVNRRHLSDHPGESELAARILSYELAFRMQTAAAEVVDFDRESPADPQTLRALRQAHPRFRPQVPHRPPADRARRAVRAALFRRRAHRRHLGRPYRLHHEPHAARRRDRPADRRAHRRPQRARVVGRNASGLGGRVRPHAHQRRRGQAGPRSQLARLFDVAGRRSRQRGPGHRRDRRTRLRRRRGPHARLRPARDHPAPDGPRLLAAHLFLQRPRPVAHPHRPQGAADREGNSRDAGRTATACYTHRLHKTSTRNAVS